MSKLRHGEWLPEGIAGLEDNAWQALKAQGNTAVIAGPGAGKTELLAQRACYLLETGLCPYPKRILAISFKRDAAKNLKERVELRVADGARRFDSLTFDAFSKSLLERFYRGLPDQWGITGDFEIAFFKAQDWDDFVNGTSVPLVFGDRYALNRINWNDFYKNYVLGKPLSLGETTPTSVLEWGAAEWWKHWLNIGGKARLGFPMIGRLAEVLLRSNPLLLDALRKTYSHIFLDEFQDTTHVQYDLVKTLFAGSKCSLTAVGDNKQQIMRWAMALEHPFSLFQKDFNSKIIPLVRNYRSSKELVRIQDEIAVIVDPHSQKTQSMKGSAISGEPCFVLGFQDREHEASWLASIVRKCIDKYDLAPRDFAILVKQKTKDFSPHLIHAFEREGLKTRDESELQDLLTERLVRIVLGYFRLVVDTARQREAWKFCTDITALLRGGDCSEDDNLLLEYEIDGFASQLEKLIEKSPSSIDDVVEIINSISSFIGKENIEAFYPEYRRDGWFDKVVKELAKNLFAQFEIVSTWPDAVYSLEGVGTTPIMTIHKSKGLEFHTVFFVGLEDESWWSFRDAPEESRCAFFVAFSRAKQRVFFTYCASNKRNEIDSLYSVLRGAGVPFHAF